ncbi:unnamed protein product [Durusdinium trenchii]|uniref:Uncharacterized protein n=3 Tax=Durusdinium trenchii TaxID=1381693 RepID=A0ABP0I7G0_9DINO
MAYGEPRFAVITNFDSAYEIGFQCAAVNEQYCKRWGIPFLPCILEKEEMESICDGRHFAWAKVALFTWLFSPERCSSAARRMFGAWLREEEKEKLVQTVDYFVWIDGDAMVIDHSRPLKDFVMGRFTRKDLILAEDMSWADCLNTGVFFARSDSAWLRSFWADTWDGSHPRFHQAPFWDQSGICQELAKRREFLPQVLGAMATGVTSGPWFSWKGGPFLKETPHLGIWDTASLQFANPLHAQFILHLCGYSAKLKLCRNLCRSGVLRNLQLDGSHQSGAMTTLSSHPMWTSARELLQNIEIKAWAWGPCGEKPSPRGCLPVISRPTPAALRWFQLRARHGDAEVVVESIANEGIGGRRFRGELWQVIDYVRGWPPPCHPVLGKLCRQQLWCTRWTLPGESRPDGQELQILHLYPPGAKIRCCAGSMELLFWILSGEMDCSLGSSRRSLAEGEAVWIQPGHEMLSTVLAPTAAICQLPWGADPEVLHLGSALGSKVVPPLGWTWFGHPENWLGAPPGHMPVDQVTLAQEKAKMAHKTLQTCSMRATKMASTRPVKVSCYLQRWPCGRRIDLYEVD